MSEEPSPVRVTCAFEGTSESLFDAFLDPAVARRWFFATKEGEMVRAEIDGREGGTFVLVDRRDGVEVEHRGRFLHLDRPARLAFEFAVPSASPSFTQVSVSITPFAPWLILSLVHEGVPPEMAARAEEGWNRMLDRLATVLDEGRAEAGPSDPAMP